jgi:hypothetical protein
MMAKSPRDPPRLQQTTRDINYFIQNFNQQTLIIQEHNAVKEFLRFFGKWTLEECKDTKLVLQLMDNILTSVFSYYMMWGYIIAKYASSCYGIQLSDSDITVQNLAVYYAHRGGKGNLGKEKTAVHCANISNVKLGKKFTHRGGKGNLGKKFTAVHCANISNAKFGKKFTCRALCHSQRW